MFNQKTATYNAIKAACKEFNIVHEDNNLLELPKHARQFVSAMLIEGFKNKQIELDKEFNEQQLKNYVTGLISNWLRKDTRFNGGVQYIAKNPGSRAGVSDPTVKALKALLSTRTDPAEIAEIQQHIDNKLQELNATKKKVSINVNDLPADLRAKYNV